MIIDQKRKWDKKLIEITGFKETEFTELSLILLKSLFYETKEKGALY